MVIRSHSVPTLPSGLSPMQERLQRSDKYVRLVSAPTGSGKSYAFMRAVLDEGAHVLFIVPTKRLLQNLMEDARAQAWEQLGARGMENARIDAWIADRIIEWSANQTSDGSASLAATRIRQILGGGTHSDGRVIFAIPEVVVKMISGIRIAGATAIKSLSLFAPLRPHRLRRVPYHRRSIFWLGLSGFTACRLGNDKGRCRSCPPPPSTSRRYSNE